MFHSNIFRLIIVLLVKLVFWRESYKYVCIHLEIFHYTEECILVKLQMFCQTDILSTPCIYDMKFCGKYLPNMRWNVPTFLNHHFPFRYIVNLNIATSILTEETKRHIIFMVLAANYFMVIGLRSFPLWYLDFINLRAVLDWLQYLILKVWMDRCNHEYVANSYFYCTSRLWTSFPTTFFSVNLTFKNNNAMSIFIFCLLHSYF